MGTVLRGARSCRGMSAAALPFPPFRWAARPRSLWGWGWAVLGQGTHSLLSHVVVAPTSMLLPVWESYSQRMLGSLLLFRRKKTNLAAFILLNNTCHFRSFRGLKFRYERQTWASTACSVLLPLGQCRVCLSFPCLSFCRLLHAAAPKFYSRSCSLLRSPTQWTWGWKVGGCKYSISCI